MADFNSWEELLAYAQSALTSVIENDVKLVIKSTMQQMINKDVYAVYTPTKYQRTGLLLSAIEGDITTTSDGVTLVVWDDANQEGVNRGTVYIPEIIEYGHWKSQLGYEFPFIGYAKLGAYVYSRPFVEDTFDELEASGVIPYTVVNGLKSRGIQVE
ncbi:hypothetical protein QB910_000032 [Dabrowskivirus KKP3916]|uniref:Uncharacterized protein n=1 Tax=Alicyclobacillus phage KKP_3916 TaxID=3040651 RepID=A0AAT9V878_9CAUD|nr:hypothetical protein QB910_000032 [Alicyclobacillus phage KKP 3916]